MSYVLLWPINTKAAELFRFLNVYISGKLDQLSCINIFMDGAAAMIWWASSFTAQLKEVTSKHESAYCVIQEKCWIVKKSYLNLTVFCRMWLKLSAILNYISSCEEIDPEHTGLLLYTGVCDFQKADHWPEFLRYNSHSKNLFLETLTTCNTFWGYRIGPKACLLTLHSPLAQWIQPVSSGKSNCDQVIK